MVKKLPAAAPVVATADDAVVRAGVAAPGHSAVARTQRKTGCVDSFS